MTQLINKARLEDTLTLLEDVSQEPTTLLMISTLNCYQKTLKVKPTNDDYVRQFFHKRENESFKRGNTSRKRDNF